MGMCSGHMTNTCIWGGSISQTYGIHLETRTRSPPVLCAMPRWQTVMSQHICTTHRDILLLWEVIPASHTFDSHSHGVCMDTVSITMRGKGLKSSAQALWQISFSQYLVCHMVQRYDIQSIFAVHSTAAQPVQVQEPRTIHSRTVGQI